MKKRGRPKLDVSKEKSYNLRMSSDEFDNLDYLSKLSGKSKADFIREAIRMYGNFVKFQNSNDDD